MHARNLIGSTLVVCVFVLLTGCPSADPFKDSKLALSDKNRELAPNVSSADLAELVAGNNQVAVDLYRAIEKNQDNLIISPHSISTALAMTYGGAKGQTETQMARVLHYTLPQDRLHPAFNALDLALAERQAAGFQLAIANRIWGQEDYSFLPEYLDTLAVNYGAGLALLDFMSNAEGSRTTINDWVSYKTGNRINDLLPEGSVGSDTRLVLTNAVYFKADWEQQFNAKLTAPAEFYLADGSTVTVSMMQQRGSFTYASGPDYQAIQMPYVGGQVAMVILLPAEGKFSTFTQSLAQGGLGAVLANFQNPSEILLHMPKFTFESTFPLAATLKDLGMRDAFSSSDADFSGMDGSRGLFISDAFHKAFVKVDEKGTEAGAATGVVVNVVSLPMEMNVNRPFIFLIRDLPTGAILFFGKVVDPR